MVFRDLKENEIECRVDRVYDNGLVLLLYKTARTDMSVLDETVGSENWQDEFYECCGNLFCKIGILIPNEDFVKTVRENITGDGYDANERTKVIVEASMPARWIWKGDTGTEGNAGENKSTASDARKRAGFCWGIGRELYTAPFIWIPSDKCNIKKNDKGKLQCKDDFIVEKIKIENKVITGLAIRNDTKKARCFVWQR